jgi:hypothetical protein
MPNGESEESACSWCNGAGRDSAAGACEAAGYKITALVRPKAKLPDSPVVRGDWGSDQGVSLQACLPVDVVFVALSGGDMPTLLEVICSAVKDQCGLLVAVFAAGLLDSDGRRVEAASDLPSEHDREYQFKTEVGRIPPHLAGVAASHLRTYKVIANSGIPYTIICPPNMPDGPVSSQGAALRVGALLAGTGMPQASTGDVAAAMLKAVDTREYHGRRVGIRSL